MVKFQRVIGDSQVTQEKIQIYLKKNPDVISLQTNLSMEKFSISLLKDKEIFFQQNFCDANVLLKMKEDDSMDFSLSLQNVLGIDRKANFWKEFLSTEETKEAMSVSYQTFPKDSKFDAALSTNLGSIR